MKLAGTLAFGRVITILAVILALSFSAASEGTENWRNLEPTALKKLVTPLVTSGDVVKKLGQPDERKPDKFFYSDPLLFTKSGKPVNENPAPSTPATYEKPAGFRFAPPKKFEGRIEILKYKVAENRILSFACFGPATESNVDDFLIFSMWHESQDGKTPARIWRLQKSNGTMRVPFPDGFPLEAPGGDKA
ncbi:MAG: hypothetical protein V4733_04450 [Verrucomicrobiota bacterium]